MEEKPYIQTAKRGPKGNLGTFAGVFTPSALTILGIILFLRLGYVVGNADLSGFSRPEQAVLAALIRGHRRKFPVGVFAALPESTAESARRLCVLLRLAALLLRGRGETKLPEFLAVAEGPMVRLVFPDGWLHDHPLTMADLEQESGYLAEVVDFRFD